MRYHRIGSYASTDLFASKETDLICHTVAMTGTNFAWRFISDVINEAVTRQETRFKMMKTTHEWIHEFVHSVLTKAVNAAAIQLEEVEKEKEEVGTTETYTTKREERSPRLAALESFGVIEFAPVVETTCEVIVQDQVPLEEQVHRIVTERLNEINNLERSEIEVLFLDKIEQPSTLFGSFTQFLAHLAAHGFVLHGQEAKLLKNYLLTEEKTYDYDKFLALLLEYSQEKEADLLPNLETGLRQRLPRGSVARVPFEDGQLKPFWLKKNQRKRRQTVLPKTPLVLKRKGKVRKAVNHHKREDKKIRPLQRSLEVQEKPCGLNATKPGLPQPIKSFLTGKEMLVKSGVETKIDSLKPKTYTELREFAEKKIQRSSNPTYLQKVNEYFDERKQIIHTGRQEYVKQVEWRRQDRIKERASSKHVYKKGPKQNGESKLFDETASEATLYLSSELNRLDDEQEKMKRKLACLCGNVSIKTKKHLSAYRTPVFGVKYIKPRKRLPKLTNTDSQYKDLTSPTSPLRKEYFQEMIERQKLHKLGVEENGQRAKRTESIAAPKGEPACVEAKTTVYPDGKYNDSRSSKAYVFPRSPLSQQAHTEMIEQQRRDLHRLRKLRNSRKSLKPAASLESDAIRVCE